MQSTTRMHHPTHPRRQTRTHGARNNPPEAVVGLGLCSERRVAIQWAVNGRRIATNRTASAQHHRHVDARTKAMITTTAAVVALGEEGRSVTVRPSADRSVGVLRLAVGLARSPSRSLRTAPTGMVRNFAPKCVSFALAGAVQASQNLLVGIGTGSAPTAPRNGTLGTSKAAPWRPLRDERGNGRQQRHAHSSSTATTVGRASAHSWWVTAGGKEGQPLKRCSNPRGPWTRRSVWRNGLGCDG